MDLQQFQLHASMEERHWWFLARRRILRRVIEGLFPGDERLTVIDLGCGTGATTAYLTSSHDTIGIDPNADAIGIARHRYPDAIFVRGSLQEAEAAIRRAELVLLTDVLEHIPEDGEFLQELLSYLLPGARVLITVPAHPRLWTRHDEVLGHYRRYTRGSLEELCDRQGVHIELLSHFNTRLFPLLLLFRLWSKWSGTAPGRAGTQLWLPPRGLNRFLEAVFAGEAGRLSAALRGRAAPYPFGLSLVAVLRKSVTLDPYSRRDTKGDVDGQVRA